MANYTWDWKLKEQGFKELEMKDYTISMYQKEEYVDKYLSPSIQHSFCGWHHCYYKVMAMKNDVREYIVLCAEKEDIEGRYINVSGNSLGGIAEAVWESVFR